ncbi:MAG: NAD(P)/FAD-dependent oxidoreductase, partial [Caulobacteraceae bacterium]|nr:NAD(P)/FAD-dependent oxidoreductase [Caulobacter sp.]
LIDDGESDGTRNPDVALATLARLAAASGKGSEIGPALSRSLAAAAAERRLARFAAMNIRILRGMGRFLDAATVAVGDERVKARRFVIATGGRQPSWRWAEDLASGVRLSLADLCRLRTAPEAVLVLGGSAEAVSAAQSLARLGSRVTLVAEALLPGYDPELLGRLEPRLRRDGIAVLRGTLERAQATPSGALATLSDGTTLTVPHLLFAEAPHPALAPLDPERAGLALRDGALVLDAALRTSKPHIFAVGRVAGARSTAEGTAQAAHVLRAALMPVAGRLKPEMVPLVAVTRPEIAQVGRLVADAGTRAFRTPLPSHADEAGGLLKVVVDRRGRIIGAGLAGSGAPDLLPFWSLAIARGLTLTDLRDAIPPSPSAAESLRAIVVQDLAWRLASPWVRHALRVARRLS